MLNPDKLDDNRPTDPSPYAGGARYGIANGSGSGASVSALCSTGFGYLRNGKEYMLTAGHCYPRNNGNRDFMWIVTGSDTSPTKSQYAGSKCCSTFESGTGTVPMGNDNQNHGDLALVNVSGAGNDAGNQVWWGGVSTTDKIPVTSRTAPTIGDDVCINGMTSGSDCGTVVQHTNVARTAGGETVRNIDVAHSTHSYDCSQGGDSGGSVVVDHSGTETAAEATGIVSGHTNTGDGGCDQWFTGVEEAMQAWGGGLNFHN